MASSREAFLDRAFSVAVILTLLVVSFRPGGFVRDLLGRWLAERQIRATWTELTTTGFRLGSTAPDAVSLVEFSDHQCPFCKAAHKAVNELIQRYPNVAVIYHPFPLAMHVLARSAALASMCASEQGAFTSMHGYLFETEEWTQDLRAEWGSIALRAGVGDPSLFLDCMSSEAAAAGLQHSESLGRKIGVTGTPTFVAKDGVLLEPASAESLATFLHLNHRSNSPPSVRSESP